jgi:uncharacterized protein (TIGR00297 family)
MSLTGAILGFALSCLISYLAYQKKSLTLDGALGAIVVGTFIYGFAGGFGFLVLMVFFFSSSLMGVFDQDKTPSKRTSIQVMANASLATFMAILYGLYQLEGFLALMIASIGVSAADTWASEMGKKSTSRPFHIFKLEPMDKGLSGAVSLRGVIASLAAALTFAFISSFVISSFFLVFMVGVISFSGSIIDSMLGTVQVKYMNPITQTLTEKKAPTHAYHSGIKYLGNNGVNFLSNMASLIIMIIII